MAQRILFASYHYPPDAAVGALRLAKFTRHLPEFGWQPYVLTIEDRLRHSGLDEQRLRGLEHVSVTKTGELPRVVEGVAKIASKVRRRRSIPRSGETDAVRSTVRTAVKEGFSARLNRYARSLFVFLPDDKKNWSLRAALSAPALIRRHEIGWILTSGPPFSVHAIGLAARMLTGCRWIADFRDPWVDMLPDRFPSNRSRPSDFLERRMEAWVVNRADRVLTTTERMRQAMMARYPSLSAEKFVCIPNSIDTDGIGTAPAASESDKLTITYAGTFYFDRTPEPLFQAVAELIACGRASANDIRIVLLGDCRQINDVETESVVRRYGLEQVVELHDRVPYPEAVAMMQRSHLLLVLAPERHRLVVPAKVYDYLGTGVAIMALAEHGATADLMRETQCGPSFSHGDIAGIRDFLAEMLEGGRDRTVRNRPEMFARYDARALTARLVSEMTAVEGNASGEVMAGT